MRILMLAQFYPPVIGGEERHVRDLSVELAERGHEVAVATLWQEGMPEFECIDGVRIYRIHGSLQRISALFREKERRHAPPFSDPEVLLALRRIIMQERPHIVHAHNWIVHSFTPIKVWSKAKLVVTLHDCSFSCVQKRFMQRGRLCTGPGYVKCLTCATQHYGTIKGIPITLANWLWKEVELNTVDMFLPVSQAMVSGNQLDKYRVPYRIIPNFIPNDLDSIPNNTDPHLAKLPEDNYLLFVGDVMRDKGIEVLLHVYAEMRSQVPLVLIGRPVIDFPVTFPPNVLILQNWPHEAIMNAWRRCIIALLPSLCLESFGIVVLEAMAMGRPVVASRIGGIPDIVVNGETGFLVTPGDERELQKAIQRLLDDADLREHMGTKAKQRVIKFQAKTVIPRIEQVYQQLIQA